MDEIAAVSQTAATLVRLTRTVQGLRHIAQNLPAPVRLRLADCTATAMSHDDAQSVIADAFRGFGVPELLFVAKGDGDLSSFEHLLSRHLCAALGAGADDFETVGLDTEMPDGLPDFVETAGVAREPGVTLDAYACGQRDAPPLVMVLPFGMPVELCAGWIAELSRHHYVVTWGTRCLFGACADFDVARGDLYAQVEDLFEVMAHFGVDDAQLMGICGGAVTAIAAAAEARRAARVTSLSLWYGDYPFGEAGLRTPHQANFEWLMEAAAQGRDEARELQQMFVDPGTLATTPREIAHLALYPYANAELFYRYACLNDALNKTDILPWMSRVTVRTLIVTGDADETTHAGGSAFVAERIPGARLVVEPGGSHTAFFGMPAPSASLARAFHRETLPVLPAAG
ncbi:pimeloyl-ACP methyl ester carboxylesterase [Paraburkholderia sp. BL8N3]|nr:alpha/beta hydrolase [Paraburkholderia sp. BL8N3]TCK33804.1 pimeloyl-ACP methyl ester carboxylesterase [Paraburkholderia sp. BL8N3]